MIDDDDTDSLETKKAEIERLAKLSPLEYELERAGASDRLGIRATALDSFVKAERPKQSTDEFALAHWATEPSTAPVHTGYLLQEIVDRIKRQVICPDEAARTIALWLAFAWTHDAWTHSPMLLVTSAERDSGKTTLLGLVNFLAPRGILVVNPTEAVLYRMIEEWNPTLIVDEADDQFKDNPPLRAVMNSGWTRGAGVPRCNPDTNKPEMFSTYGPKAVGMKGLALPDTLLSRSIKIVLARKKPGENVADFSHLDDGGLNDLRRRLARFAVDNAEALAAAQPVMPDGFQNRLAANWRPLPASAELAGGDWPALARKAAIALTPTEATSVGTILLADIYAMATARGVDRLTSTEIVDTLHDLEDRPWAEWGRQGKPISKNQVARILSDFRIYSGSIRVGDRTPKGYHLSAFAEAFERYLGVPGGNETPQRNNADETGTSGPSETPHADSDVAFQTSEKPASNGHCGVVADGIPPLGPDEQFSPICEHCNGSGNVQRCAVNGETFFLHPECQDDWLKAKNSDLSIPRRAQPS